MQVIGNGNKYDISDSGRGFSCVLDDVQFLDYVCIGSCVYQTVALLCAMVQLL